MFSGAAVSTSMSEGCDADLIGVVNVVTSLVESGGEEIDVVDSMSQQDARSANSLKYLPGFHRRESSRNRSEKGFFEVIVRDIRHR